MRKRRSGFTLMELMVTVVIIGILAGAALPQYGKMVDRVREVEGIGNLSALLTAQLMHFHENAQFSTQGNVLLVVPPAMPLWSIPGGSANSAWTVTPATAQITLTSQGHGHADPASHEIRGRVNSDGTFVIEVKRPGDSVFRPL